MRFGFCAGLDKSAGIANYGYDYIEPPVAPILRPEEPEESVMPPLRRLCGATSLRPETFNVFLPGNLKITGPNTDPTRRQSYVQAAFARVSSLGGEIVVFGSGGARGIPERFPRDEAWSQIAAFLTMAAPIAAAQGITIAIEPLNRTECNIINSVAEALRMARDVNHAAVRVLSDLYHVDVESQSYDETRAAGASLAHVHVAGQVGRRTPIEDDVDFLARYFAALKAAGYDGRISVEATVSDLDREAPIALQACRKAWDLA